MNEGKGRVGLPRSVPSCRPERRLALPQSLSATVRNLSQVMVYIWLKNGMSFWYYVLYSDSYALRGYLSGKIAWQRADIPLQHIWSYY